MLAGDVLNELPDAYDAETWQRKSDAVFNHIFASYYDDGHSVYHDAPGAVAVVTAPPPVDVPVELDIAQ